MAKKSNNLFFNNILLLTIAFILVVMFGFFVTNLNSKGSQNKYQIGQDLEAKKLTTLVDEAAELIKEKGTENAFSEFRKVDSKWRSGNTYIFVYDTKGVTLLLPPQANLEGTSRLKAHDTKGVYYVQEMINYLNSKNSGWLTYQYIKPGSDTESTKLTYFKKVTSGGKILIVGSGVYLD